MKFNEKSDEYLEKFYESVGAKTFEQKYNALVLELGYQNHTINFSHDPTWEQKAGSLEYDLLEREGLYKIEYY